MEQDHCSMMPAFDMTRDMTRVELGLHAVAVVVHHAHLLVQTSHATLAEEQSHRCPAYGSRSREHGCHHRGCGTTRRRMQRTATTRCRFLHQARRGPEADPAAVAEPFSELVSHELGFGSGQSVK